MLAPLCYQVLNYVLHLHYLLTDVIISTIPFTPGLATSLHPKKFLIQCYYFVKYDSISLDCNS